MRNKNKRIIFLVTLTVGLRGLYGLPEGSEPTSGGGTFSTQGTTMTFTAPDGSVFRHSAFNVANGETVKFVQPSANARVLNRIDASSSSTIDGRVEANGELYFAAPGGLIFGEGSVIQARHLQAVAGSVNDSNWDQTPQFEGTIENRGSIAADTIILGGKTVTNRGDLSAANGSILLVAGGGMEISSQDGSRVVQISDSLQTSESMAGDFYGHALLESGILESSNVQVSASSVTQKGTIKASQVVFSEITDISGDEGTIHAGEVVINAQANRFPDVSLGGKNNQISKVTLNGSFNEVKVRSAQPMQLQAQVGSEMEQTSTVQIQKGDFRTDSGNLSLHVSFAPISTVLDSSMVLAAKTGSIQVTNYDSLQNYGQVVVYGNNVMEEIASGFSELDEDWFVLNATSLDFDSLTSGLDAKSIFLLEDENPSLNLTGTDLIAGGSSGEQSSEGSNAPILSGGSDGDSEVSNGTSNGSSGGSDLVAPSGTPSLGNLVSSPSNTNRLSESQLASAMSVGLYSDHSYLLQSMPADEYTLMQLADAGGTGLLFGGSYDTVGSGSSSSTEASTPDTDSEASGTDSESDDASSDDQSDVSEAQDSSADSQEAKNASMIKRVMIGSAPLSPITRPVYSPQANQMLEQALIPMVEETLKGFSNR
jgi:filamentous hemagglutinin family protein